LPAVPLLPISPLVVRQRFATTALVIAWLCANGALWDTMQVAAWTKMFASYAPSMSITQALRETLDPAKKCKICIAIAKARDATEKQTPAPEQLGAAKFVLAIHTVDTPVFANDSGDWMAGQPSSVAERTDPVPLPPPRV
jgi:hypothetical protein